MQASTSVIEGQRQSHYLLETYEAHLVSLLVPEAQAKFYAVGTQKAVPIPQRTRIKRDLRATALLDRIVDTSDQLTSSYGDSTAERRRELDALAGRSSLATTAPSGSGEMDEFYARLSALKEHHRRYPDQSARLMAEEDEQSLVDSLAHANAANDEGVDGMFTGEEALGRYLDLLLLHSEFNNLPGQTEQTRLAYLPYLDAVTRFDTYDRSRKTSGQAYATYLKNLLAYIESFYQRVFPLLDIELEKAEAQKAFEIDWAQGAVRGWAQQAAATNGASEDASEGIYCEACQKHYSKQTVYDAHLTSKKHLKAAARPKTQTNGHANGSPAPAHTKDSKRDREKALAAQEAIIRRLMDHTSSPLIGIKADTKSNVERKASLTDHERQLELEEMEIREAKEIAAALAGATGTDTAGQATAEEEEDDGTIYNPKRLPLGWDGKPIPYWLYRLHGLGVEYKCEICSDHVYMGRKNFERHFMESRHAFGMRALGLPNTKHFAEITKIEDALALASKLKAEGKQEQHRAEEMEELEDADGNVYNRKVFEDLKKQGLL
ncbi:uncharacterized protein L969DRAFT_89486 [Mixia osmundae IAM 14324]|uniref:C2H2-type domain-containing protein n=1 Tax=Mixia osmundae (strain CBS 9802 / IAM 14324 / JCM 22182 / KY 12970) TaxID=764103 RepID=G7DS55_MIXOS|nr:uncharacterized protein L969DRAFT_89486 [Mixia osmundae IAM 14324]KEI37531.1 hypothetical protein L969DRAFT_89486 [Mixia osmundae IAM 14324]GAA93415.1 hypothetical protein E5Q_00056 [Mixia osmundae IAM 14324]